MGEPVDSRHRCRIWVFLVEGKQRQRIEGVAGPRALVEPKPSLFEATRGGTPPVVQNV